MVSKPQFITTPSGDEMVVLARADYERLAELAEETADAAVYQRAVQRLAAGDDEIIPWDMAKRLRAGENPVQVWRAHRGLTVAALADKAGLDEATVAAIETDLSAGSVAALAELARALGVAIEVAAVDLFPGPQPGAR